jgi:hypothetical protein
VVLLWFCLIHPYQVFSQNKPASIFQETEECFISAGEIENFSEFKNSEVHSVFTNPIGELVLAFSASYFTIPTSHQFSAVNLKQDFRQPPNASLLCVFRI